MDTKIFEERESEIRGYCRAYPTVFKKAHGATMVDEDGKSYIDFFAGAGVLNFGHNNPAMKKAIIDLLENDGMVHSLDMYTVPKREFVQEFVDTVLKPRGMNHKMQFMGPTGTNAVEAALKLARRVTGRTEVAAFIHGFHGMTLGSLAATANSYFRNASGIPLHNVTHFPFGCEKTCAGCQSGCGMDSLAQIRAMYEDSSSGQNPPAAFLVEAIQAEGGVKVASAEWLQGVQKLARDLGALFIIDDIQSGCGRTGSYFSFDGMDLDPDIVTLAKGLGGYGTPIAMNLVKPEHDKHWQPGEHTGTFRGQGISFVAGKEALNYFKDDTLMSAVKTKGEKMWATLIEIQKEFPALNLDVRGKGMIVGIDIANGDKSKAIARECFDNGLLVGPCGTGGRVIKLIPPLTIEEKQLDEGLEILKKAARKILG